MKQYIRTSQSVEQDSMGNPLTPEQVAFFKDSKIRDNQGRLLVCYHGTKKAGFEEFLPQDFTDALYYKFGKSNVNFFTTEKQNAMGYADYMFKRQPDGTWEEPDPYDFIPNEYGKKSGIYAVYLDIKNPLIVDPDDSLYDKKSPYDDRYWKNIKRDGAPKRAKIEKFFNKYHEYMYDFISDVFDWEPDFEKDLKRIGISVTPDDDEYEFRVISNNNDMWSDSNGSHLTTTDNMEDLLDELEYNFEDYQTDEYYTKESTNDIIIDTLLDHPKYDGIIFKDIIDSAGILGSVKQTTIVTLKGSNQIKSINNKKPTDSGNINAGTENSMKRYVKASSNLDNYRLSEKDILLGKTPAKEYIWYNEDIQVAQLHIFDWWDGLNIEDLEINPEYRGQGLSYKLLDFATKELGAKNLAVAKDNDIAKHVYDKYGFKVTDEDEDYYYMSII